MLFEVDRDFGVSETRYYLSSALCHSVHAPLAGQFLTVFRECPLSPRSLYRGDSPA